MIPWLGKWLVVKKMAICVNGGQVVQSCTFSRRAVNPLVVDFDTKELDRQFDESRWAMRYLALDLQGGSGGHLVAP